MIDLKNSYRWVKNDEQSSNLEKKVKENEIPF